jgi:hypothetical protein
MKTDGKSRACVSLAFPSLGPEVSRAGVFANWPALSRRQRNKVEWQMLSVFSERSVAATSCEFSCFLWRSFSKGWNPVRSTAASERPALPNFFRGSEIRAHVLQPSSRLGDQTCPVHGEPFTVNRTDPPATLHVALWAGQSGCAANYFFVSAFGAFESPRRI